MLRINYTNPLTKQYQYEYAMYSIVSGMFEGVECRSLTLEQLKLYHAELVKESRSDNSKEKYSYTKQKELDNEVLAMVKRDVVGHIEFPQMNICKAEVKIRKDKNGSHSFTFTDGVYSFTLRMQAPRKGRRGRILVSGRKISGIKTGKGNVSVKKNARLCA